LKGIAIGAGNRGLDAYAPYLRAHPDEGHFVAVADPVAARRERFARRHGVPEADCAPDFRELLARPQFADFAVVTTPDALHVEPAIQALRSGYHVLLEKPMALTESDCRQLVDESARADRVLQICHVLRYTPLFEALKRCVESGELGRVVTIQHAENLSYWHYAHSYCRGNWRNVAVSSPMILAKSCHDMDILHWLAAAPPRRVSSFARPTELCEANAPEGAPEFCIQGCPHSASCSYDAAAMYLDLAPVLQDAAQSERPLGLRRLVTLFRAQRRRLDALALRSLRGIAPWTGWPVSAISDDRGPAAVEAALRDGPYGRCVYRVGDNDQVSSQTVQIEFANQVNASFTLHSTSHREGREIRIDGTRGSAIGYFYNLEQGLEVIDHKTAQRRKERFPLQMGLHGGGDGRLFADFLAALRGDSKPMTSAAESLWSHRMAFAADRSQREGRVVEINAAG
jgi:predicted dehydrogenase